MRHGIHYNRDLSAELASLITSHSAGWVMEQQPIDWRPATWKNHWIAHNLPHPQVLDELQEEYTAHGRIRRSFILTYQDRSPIELFIAAMAWGLGPDNRGPAKVGKILDRSDAAEAIEAVVNTVRHEGAAAGYSKYYSGHKLPQLDVAFITKVLYFAGYKFPGYPKKRHPWPLIYDNLAATAAIRLPEAPLLPSIRERVSANAYERYCRWAEKTAADHGTEPAVLEWALFRLGGRIRDELQA
jgi:hypothetical protein